MPKKSESYEEILSKLESIVNTMENTPMALQDSLKAYEDGVKLCNKLYAILNEAESKVKILNENIEEDFKE